MDIETGYVAVTRFQHADDVLILEPFELSDFQRGSRLEIEIYLAHCQSGFKGLKDPTVKSLIDECTLSKKPKQPKRTRNTTEESGIPGFVLNKCAKCNTVMPMHKRWLRQNTKKRKCLKCSPQDYPKHTFKACCFKCRRVCIIDSALREQGPERQICVFCEHGFRYK